MSGSDLFELWLGGKKEIISNLSIEKANDHSLSRLFINAVLTERIPGFSPDMIDRNEHGKPVLPEQDYSFNLSHCGELYALLLCSIEFCGVDIQTVKNREKFDDALKSVLTDREYGVIDKDGKNEDFFQLWSVKEAYIKALGESIWFGRDYDFGTVPGQYSDKWFESNGLYLYSMEIRKDVFLSIAVPSQPERIDFRKFP